MKLDFQRVKTHWNRGFIASWRGPYSWIVMLLTPVWPESGFRRVAPQSQPLAKRQWPTSGTMEY
jgi:hypothetical protein